MDILITGVAGFIGSHLSEKLLEMNNNITGIDNFDTNYSKNIKIQNLQKSKENSNFQFYEIDIRDTKQLSLLEAKKFDLIIHLAAKVGILPSMKFPEEYINTNINGTRNILEFMRSIDCKKLIFSSSSSIYGNNKKIPFSENDTVDNPISPYAFTKRSCELLNYYYHYHHKFNIINLRFFTVYGPRQRPDLAIHIFFNKIYKNEIIDIFGDGNTGRDYTFVDDIVNGIISSISFINNQPHTIYENINLGNNNPIKLIELIDIMKKITKKPVLTTHLPQQPGDVDLTYADITKAQKFLNFNPKISIVDGLNKFKYWYENK